MRKKNITAITMIGVSVLLASCAVPIETKRWATISQYTCECSEGKHVYAKLFRSGTDVGLSIEGWNPRWERFMEIELDKNLSFPTRGRRSYQYGRDFTAGIDSSDHPEDDISSGTVTIDSDDGYIDARLKNAKGASSYINGRYPIVKFDDRL